ncbi:hypothetical protein [Bartonella saheliensis]|uniref:hypothetical protein n=1 Tax=Bartonella saheliensis TaxID=1457016 RepID=UPI00140BCFA6|nr:hypothetical protein [Bartonella saheliensis]
MIVCSFLKIEAFEVEALTSIIGAFSEFRGLLVCNGSLQWALARIMVLGALTGLVIISK